MLKCVYEKNQGKIYPGTTVLEHKKNPSPSIVKKKIISL